MEKNKVHNLNFLNNTLPDGCANLIIADPPYFEVKGEFDFIWPTFEDYLLDVRKWAAECYRLLADNGTLFWYGDAKKIAYSQVILDETFALLNSLVWKKNECQTLRNEVAALRSWAPITERILMYDKGEDKSGNDRIFDDPELFMPVKKYFDDWLDKSGLTLKEAVAEIGSSCTHWFGFSIRPKTQFSFPTEDKWDKMEALFPNRKSYAEVSDNYRELRTSYEDLRLSYESLRRPFSIDKMQGDVLEFSQESHITKQYKHDTKKPETLTRYLLRSTTVKDPKTNHRGTAVIPFSGSGTEAAMCIKEGMDVYAFELEEKHAITGNARIARILETPTLF